MKITKKIIAVAIAVVMISIALISSNVYAIVSSPEPCDGIAPYDVGIEFYDANNQKITKNTLTIAAGEPVSLTARINFSYETAPAAEPGETGSMPIALYADSDNKNLVVSGVGTYTTYDFEYSTEAGVQKNGFVDVDFTATASAELDGAKITINADANIEDSETSYGQATLTVSTLPQINEATVTLVAPKVGDKVEKVKKTSDGYEYDAQSVKPTVTTTTKGLKVNAFWTVGTGEEAEELFYGTFEEGKSYYALVDFMAEEGYQLSNTFTNNIKVNGSTPVEVGDVMMGTYEQCVVKVTPTVATENEVDNKQEQNKEEFVIADDDDDDADDETAILLEEIRKMLDDLLAGARAAGIDEATASGVAGARAAGKQVKVDLSAKEVAREEVAEDVEKAEAKLEANEKVAGIFDVSINLKAGNDQLGKVTKLNKKVAFKLPIPKEIRTVPAGYERIFSMLRIHDGVTSRMDVESDGENVSGESDEYSTYVLTYTDTKITSNPKTGDMIGLYISIFTVTSIGAAIVLKKINK